MVRRQDPTAAIAGELDDRAPIGRLEYLAGQDLVRRSEGHLPAVEAEDSIPAPRLLHVMGGDQGRPPLAREPGEQRFEPFRAGGVKAAEGLIEEDDSGILDQR